MNTDYQYKPESHRFVPLYKTGKQVCSRCGFVLSKNAISQWVSEKGCRAHYHPQYEKKLKQLTGFEE